ncbi:unnamed protein product [Ceratitis capitata]|uniref:(Mediterranean fruit fly) hypothetical protein n=1 Tax=Ceratitis capitata TaxID=7213 RepID=W8BY67_CERCA|nr:unnamed protein product [Ceratitis capitata]
MDLNHRLIEAVRQCPLLYKNNVTLSDRKCGWQQIAEQMKMREALLKTRWHFLREHYKRTTLTESQLNSSHFPYKKEMEFLLPYLRPSPKGEQRNEGEPLPVNIIKPEFVITEKDLENDSGNEEYVFLEVEALGSEYETTNEDAQQISESELRKELQEELRKELQEDQQEEGQQQHEEDESEDLGHLELEVHIKQEKLDEMPTHNDNPKIIFVKENSHEKMEATCNRNGSKEDESVRCQIQDAVEEKKIIGLK